MHPYKDLLIGFTVGAIAATILTYSLVKPKKVIIPELTEQQKNDLLIQQTREEMYSYIHEYYNRWLNKPITRDELTALVDRYCYIDSPLVTREVGIMADAFWEMDKKERILPGYQTRPGTKRRTVEE